MCKLYAVSTITESHEDNLLIQMLLNCLLGFTITMVNTIVFAIIIIIIIIIIILFKKVASISTKLHR